MDRITNSRLSKETEKKANLVMRVLSRAAGCRCPAACPLSPEEHLFIAMIDRSVRDHYGPLSNNLSPAHRDSATRFINDFGYVFESLGLEKEFTHKVIGI